MRESAGKDLNGKIYDYLDREYHECYLSRFSDPTHSESFMPAAYYYMQKQFAGGRARLCMQKRRRQPERSSVPFWYYCCCPCFLTSRGQHNSRTRGHLHSISINSTPKWIRKSHKTRFKTTNKEMKRQHSKSYSIASKTILHEWPTSGPYCQLTLELSFALS